MNSAIVHLEQSVREADGKLDMITWQIDAFEKEFQDPDNEISVLRLLRSVTQVKEEYQTLRRDILEVQQLQKQLSDSLKAQLSQVQGHFNILRDKIVGQKPTPQLNRMMDGDQNSSTSILRTTRTNSSHCRPACSKCTGTERL